METPCGCRPKYVSQAGNAVGLDVNRNALVHHRNRDARNLPMVADPFDETVNLARSTVHRHGPGHRLARHAPRAQSQRPVTGEILDERQETIALRRSLGLVLAPFLFRAVKAREKV